MQSLIKKGSDPFSSMLPTSNMQLLKALISKKIVSVKRQLYKGDMDIENYDQNADGPIELGLDDGSFIHFIALTEEYSVGVLQGEMSPYGDSYSLVDTSNNSFWKKRLKETVDSIAIFISNDASDSYPCEFGIEMIFSNKTKVFIEYVDSERFPDTVHIFHEYKDCKSNCVNISTS